MLQATLRRLGLASRQAGVGVGLAGAFRHRARLRAVGQAIERALEGPLLRTRVGTRIFYGLVSDAFEREHRAVAAGRRMYSRTVREHRRSSYMLRRNTHRLEKGLVARRRRDVFALDFIAETLAEFETLAADFDQRDDLTPDIRWSRDVLERYFEVTDPADPVLAPLRERFARSAARLSDEGAGTPSAPFVRSVTSPVEVEALQALAVQRRSVRSYLPDPVPRDLVDRAISVAAQSPSACNRQPFVFLVFDDPSIARQVGEAPAGTKSYVDDIRSIVVVVGRLRAYAGERDRHAIYVDASLAAMSFILALEAQGIGSCAINWGDDRNREARIARMLELDQDERVIMMISYGWPDPAVPVPFSAKRPLDELRRYNPACHAS